MRWVAQGSSAAILHEEQLLAKARVATNRSGTMLVACASLRGELPHAMIPYWPESTDTEQRKPSTGFTRTHTQGRGLFVHRAGVIPVTVGLQVNQTPSVATQLTPTHP